MFQRIKPRVVDMPVPAFQGRARYTKIVRSCLAPKLEQASLWRQEGWNRCVVKDFIHLGKAALMLEIGLGVFWCTERDLKEEREEDRRRERARAGGVWHFVELRWSSPVRFSSLQTGAIRRFSRAV